MMQTLGLRLNEIPAAIPPVSGGDAPPAEITGLTYASLPATVTGAAAYAAPPYILMTRA